MSAKKKTNQRESSEIAAGKTEGRQCQTNGNKIEPKESFETEHKEGVLNHIYKEIANKKIAEDNEAWIFAKNAMDTQSDPRTANKSAINSNTK